MGNLRNEKRLQYERDYYIRNKSRKLLAKYGITEEAYEEMLLEQGGVCAICNGTNTNGKVLSVDHDHDTDAVRGLLCSRCNFMIGQARDIPELLEEGAHYLRERE